MGEFSDEILKSNLSVPIRIWTDFERVNKTHFWSENAESWWSYDVENESHTWGYWRMIPGMSNIRSHFVDSVVCDGNKKLSNRPLSASCICTSKYFVFFHSKYFSLASVRVQWKYQWLLILLAFSFIVLIFGTSKICRRPSRPTPQNNS